jgi:hypothetical protein
LSSDCIFRALKLLQAVNLRNASLLASSTLGTPSTVGNLQLDGHIQRGSIHSGLTSGDYALNAKIVLASLRFLFSHGKTYVSLSY